MKLRGGLRSVAWRVAPELMANRAVRYEAGLRERLGLTQAARDFIAEHGDQVQAGPVAGLRYWAEGDSAIPKLAGHYEAEIADWIDQALLAQPPVFIDFGAADGYYAIGIKRRLPSTAVHAFDLSSVARQRLNHIAGLNEVVLDGVGGAASLDALRSLVRAGALLLCDIEGGEVELLNQAAARALSSSTVIVELHDGIRPGAAKAITAAFAATHKVEIVRSTSVDELRSFEVSWARCLPKSTV